LTAARPRRNARRLFAQNFLPWPTRSFIQRRAKLLALSDSQLQMLMDTSRPIAVDRRDAFLHDVAATLATMSSIGDGQLHRILRELQRRHMDYPILAGHPSPPHSRDQRRRV